MAIAFRHALEVLQEVGSFGNLLYCGEKIFVNPWKKAHLRFSAQTVENAKVRVTLLLDENRAGDFLLIRGMPSLVLYEKTILPIDEDIEWNWLRHFQKGKEALFTLSQFAAMKEEMQEWIVKGHSACQIMPKPVVHLQDPYGATIDLRFSYEGIGEFSYSDLRQSIGGFSRQLEEENLWTQELLANTSYKKGVVGSSNFYSEVNLAPDNLRLVLGLGFTIFDKEGRLLLEPQSVDWSVEKKGDTFAVKGSVQSAGCVTCITELTQATSPLFPLSGGKTLLIDWSAFPTTWSQLKDLRVEEGAIIVEKRDVGCLLALEKLEHLLPKKAFLPMQGAFQGTLYPYQLSGVERLKHLYSHGFSALLADDMGLGKTVQILSFLAQIDTKHPHLILVPASLLSQWEREIRQFLPNTPLYVHYGAKRASAYIKKTSIVLSSHTLFRLEKSLFSDVCWEVVVVDEAQCIKNPHSQLFTSVCDLKSVMRIAVTGTPMENDLQDVVTLFTFLDPSLTFTKSVEGIRCKMAPFLIRRKKEEVLLDLPKKVVQEIWVFASPAQRSIYNQVGREEKNRKNIFEAILRLRQACCDPRLVQDTSVGEKTMKIVEDVEQVCLQGGAVLIFSQFTQYLDLLKEHLASTAASLFYLSGATRNRQAIIDRFQSCQGAAIFLMSLKAGGVGLNLTRADYVFIVDPWWNNAAEEQAIARAHRLGRKGSVIVRRYFMADTIEEQVQSLKSEKAALARALLDVSI